DGSHLLDHLRSFPTRRSSDLRGAQQDLTSRRLRQSTIGQAWSTPLSIPERASHSGTRPGPLRRMTEAHFSVSSSRTMKTLWSFAISPATCVPSIPALLSQE